MRLFRIFTGHNLIPQTEILTAPWVACRCCFRQMTGIASLELRDTCDGCGGVSLVNWTPETQPKPEGRQYRIKELTVKGAQK